MRAKFRTVPERSSFSLVLVGGDPWNRFSLDSDDCCVNKDPEEGFLFSRLEEEEEKEEEKEEEAPRC